MSPDSPEKSSSGDQINREQRRLDRLDAREDRKIDVKPVAGEAAEKDPTEVYLKRVNNVQGKIARLREKAAVQKDARDPRWQKTEKLCAEIEQRLLSKIERVDRRTLFHGIADFNNAIQEYLAELRGQEKEKETTGNAPPAIAVTLSTWGIPGERLAETARSIAGKGWTPVEIRHLHEELTLIEKLPPGLQRRILGVAGMDRRQAAGILAGNAKEGLNDAVPVQKAVRLLLGNTHELVERTHEEFTEEIGKRQAAVAALLEKEREAVQDLSGHLKAKDWDAQDAQVAALGEMGNELIERQNALSALRAERTLLDLAFAKFDALRARGRGDETGADRLLMRLYELGEDLASADPDLWKEGKEATERLQSRGILRPFEARLLSPEASQEALMTALLERRRAEGGALDLLNQTEGFRKLAVRPIARRTVRDTAPSPGELLLSGATLHPLLSPRFGRRGEGQPKLSISYLVETDAGFAIAMPSRKKQETLVSLSDGTTLNLNARNVLKPGEVEAASGRTFPAFLSHEAATLIADAPSGVKVVLRHRPVPITAPDGSPILTITTKDLALTQVKGDKLRVISPRQNLESEADIPALRREEAECANDVLRAVDRDPSIRYVAGRAAAMGKGLSTLNALFSTALDPKNSVSKSKKFVSFMRGKAQEPLFEIQKTLADPRLPDALKQARKHLQSLRENRNQSGLSASEWDDAIAERMRAIDDMVSLIGNQNQIRGMLETIIDKAKFDDDSWANWLRTEGPKFLAAIAVATAAAISIATTFGAATPLWVIAAGTAAGGIIGYELESEAVYMRMQEDPDVKSGKARYTDRSLLGKFFAPEEFDPDTGQLKVLGGWETAGTYGMRFARDFAVTFATMGIGRALASRISVWAQNSMWMQRMLASGSFQRMSGNLGRIKATYEGIVDKSIASKFAAEVAQELSEEGAENGIQIALEKIDARLGMLAGILVAVTQSVRMRPGGVDLDLPAGMTKANAQAKLLRELQGHGHEASSLADGTVVAKLWSGESVRFGFQEAGKGARKVRVAESSSHGAGEVLPVAGKKKDLATDVHSASSRQREREMKMNREHQLRQSMIGEVVSTEQEIARVALRDDGTLIISNALRSNARQDVVAKFRSTPGVIDVQCVSDCVIVVYNSDKAIPQGCPDLFAKGRSGEYSPSEKIVFVDIKDSYSFLDGSYQASNISPIVPHELRHHLVRSLDQRVVSEVGGKEVNRYNPKESDAGSHEAAYLDELHSHYFDYLEGRNPSGLSSVKEKFYTTAGSGPHTELVGPDQLSRQNTQELFFHVQGLLLLDTFSRSPRFSKYRSIIEPVVQRCGASFGALPSVPEALSFAKGEWQRIMDNPSLRKEFQEYLTLNEYVPDKPSIRKTNEFLNALHLTSDTPAEKIVEAQTMAGEKPVSDPLLLAKGKNVEALKNYLKSRDVDDATRINLAEELLGPPPLNKAQRDALLAAHNKPGAIDEGNQGKNTVKGLELMRDKVFNREQAELLMKAGLAGAPAGVASGPGAAAFRVAPERIGTPILKGEWHIDQDVFIKRGSGKMEVWKIEKTVRDGSLTKIQVVNKQRTFTRFLAPRELDPWNPWKIGDIVTMVRSDGSRETGCKVIAPMDGGSFLVGKGRVGKGGFAELVSPENLKQWNPWKSEEAVWVEWKNDEGKIRGRVITQQADGKYLVAVNNEIIIASSDELARLNPSSAEQPPAGMPGMERVEGLPFISTPAQPGRARSPGEIIRDAREQWTASRHDPEWLARREALRAKQPLVMGLPDTPEGLAKRVEMGEQFLHDFHVMKPDEHLTTAQKEAILEAHKRKYSLEEKSEILRQSGLTLDQFDVLLRTGTCGTDIPPPPPPPPRKPKPEAASPKPSVPGKLPPPPPPPLRKKPGEAAPSALSSAPKMPLSLVMGQVLTIKTSQGPQRYHVLATTADSVTLIADAKGPGANSFELPLDRLRDLLLPDTVAAPSPTPKAAPKASSAPAKAISRTQRALETFNLLEETGSSSFSDIRSQLASCKHRSLWRKQAEYDRRVAELDRAYRARFPGEKPLEFKSEEDYVRHITRTLDALVPSSHATNTIVKSNGYSLSYGPELPEQAGLKVFYINPRYERYADIIRILDTALKGENASVKFNLEDVGRGHNNKIIVYFAQDDFAGVDRFLKSVASQPDFALSMDPPPLISDLIKFKIPLLPGMTYVERPTVMSWDTGIFQWLYGTADAGVGANINSRWLLEGKMPTPLEIASLYGRINPTSKQSRSMPALLKDPPPAAALRPPRDPSTIPTYAQNQREANLRAAKMPMEVPPLPGVKSLAERWSSAEKILKDTLGSETSAFLRKQSGVLQQAKETIGDKKFPPTGDPHILSPEMQQYISVTPELRSLNVLLVRLNPEQKFRFWNALLCSR